jgi:hypothetical protein
MKNLLITLFTLAAGAAVGQTTCPQIQISYDQAGNRTQRKLEMVPCPTAPPIASRAASEELTGVNVYPNPTHYQVNIELEKPTEGEDNNTLVTVFDISGKEMQQLNSSQSKITMDVSALGAGTFYLQVVRGGKKKSFSLMKY